MFDITDLLGVRGDVPAHVKRRRLKTGRLAREAIYGCRLKGVPGDAANRWKNHVTHYCGKGYLTYREFLDVARDLGKHLKHQGAHLSDIYEKQLDFALWALYRDKLIERSFEINGPVAEEGSRLDLFRQNRERAIVEQWQREALFNGLCPVCGTIVSEGDFCGHGFGKPQPDGKSGFVVDA